LNKEWELMHSENVNTLESMKLNDKYLLGKL
jgi:hypothetical protein